MRIGLSNEHISQKWDYFYEHQGESESHDMIKIYIRLSREYLYLKYCKFFIINMFSIITVFFGVFVMFIIFCFSVTITAQPTNESELQLYRVLQRANLLTYYDVFIAQGN